jgi:O-antigen/teichoic acid export membrane protein
MYTRQINRASSVVLILLALAATITVVTGLVWPPPLPEADEGTQAHIFQIAIVGLLPTAVLVIGTADWAQPWRSMRPLAISIVLTALAFGGLYYLEHFR